MSRESPDVSIQKCANKDGTTSFIARVRNEYGKQQSQTFRKRADAVTWEAREKLAMATGDWISPERGKTTVGKWIGEWTPTQVHLRASSRSNDETIIRCHILPRWEKVAFKDLHYLLAARWVGELAEQYAPATVNKISNTFSKILKDAVRSRYLASNPMEGVRLPTIERKEVLIPTAEQVAFLTEKIDPRYRAWTITAAYSGLRFGELAGLRWGRVNVLRNRIEVVETAYEQRNGVVAFNQQPSAYARFGFTKNCAAGTETENDGVAAYCGPLMAVPILAQRPHGARRARLRTSMSRGEDVAPPWTERIECTACRHRVKTDPLSPVEN